MLSKQEKQLGEALISHAFPAGRRRAAWKDAGL